MIDPEKVMLMTRLAAFEKREEKKALSAGGFFQADFTAWELLKAFVCGTIAFLVVLGLIVFANFDLLLQEVYEMDLVEKGWELLRIYVIYMIILVLGTYLSAVLRFRKARKSLRAYYQGLRRLGEFYEGD